MMLTSWVMSPLVLPWTLGPVKGLATPIDEAGIRVGSEMNLLDVTKNVRKPFEPGEALAVLPLAEITRDRGMRDFRVVQATQTIRSL
jgi:hypothetical protein